jgi:hypothetical protein
MIGNTLVILNTKSLNSKSKLKSITKKDWEVKGVELVYAILQVTTF